MMGNGMDSERVSKYEHAVWERCARGYTDGFGVREKLGR